MQKPTEQNQSKLEQVLEYLTNSRGFTPQFSQNNLHMKTYIDVAYGSYTDGKSHSGLISMLINACVFVVLSK